MTNYFKLNVKEIHQLLVEHKITPLDLVVEAIDKIENSQDNAFITLNKEEAMKQARALEGMEPDNLFFGIPVAVKDNIVTKGLTTTCASKMLMDFNPVYDATVVEKLKERHMIIIGKTNMDEFAMGSTGETSYFGHARNPWNKDLVTGGSSSGSASSVSSRTVPVALGSDTGGSIRQPASFCGIVGLKPTYGRVSRNGLIAFGSSLDAIGPMTKNVFDNAALLNVIAGYDKNDYTTSSCDVPDYTSVIGKDISHFKIAVPNYYMGEKIDKTIRNQVTSVIDMLKGLGCQIDFVDIDYLEYAIPLYQVIALGEASSNLARFDGIRFGHKTEQYQDVESLYKDSRSEGFGPEVKRRIMIGSYVLSGENAHIYYHKALTIRHAMVESFKKCFETYDLLIGPTNTNCAYQVGIKQDDALKSFYDDILTIPVNMAGLPAMSMPIGFNEDHLPIGMHIIGNYFKEADIYQLASFIEQQLNLVLEPGVE